MLLPLLAGPLTGLLELALPFRLVVVSPNCRDVYLLASYHATAPV
jgi:hypothetical protein